MRGAADLQGEHTPHPRKTIITAGLVVLGALPGVAQSLEIWEIQGSGMSSPFRGQNVSTSNNVVTAVGDDGFFIQCPADRTDGDPWTSDGIFVDTGSSPSVETGDLVDVAGRVRESFGQTELSGSLQVTVVGSGHQVPAPFDFDAETPTPFQPWPETELERFEGMRVRVRQAVVSSPSDGHGEACLSASALRLYREPGILYPGLPGLGVWDGNPEGFELDPYGLGENGIELAAGTIVSADGVLAYSRGNADAPHDLENVASTALRSSDHDGMVVFFGPRTRTGTASRLVPEVRNQKRSPTPR